MSAEEDVLEITSGELEHITTPLDVKTYLVDGVKGIAVTQNLVRISFTENVLDTNVPNGTKSSIKGRHVVNLAIERQSFVLVMDLLNRVLADLGSSKND